ncbi:MAG: NAD-dependent epimerase/dehydratase family protein, partial [Rhodospirillales bacterium]|nr:NAD-dependent epimerase/dehydratase family protein [Rhodospirillales bacterium]
AQFIRNAVRGEPIVLKSAGTQCFTFCHVADAVQGLLLTCLKGAPGEAYNIAGPGMAITLRELAELLAARTGTTVAYAQPDAVESRGFSTAVHAVLDGGKIAKLGFIPRYAVGDGVLRTVAILRAEDPRHAPEPTAP